MHAKNREAMKEQEFYSVQSKLAYDGEESRKKMKEITSRLF